ncbi:MAG: acyl-CoA dehydrogenase [Frankiaceae bacterium]|nr:acyl-CoA dehydrogenase [Frankiaceae bacterium]
MSIAVLPGIAEAAKVAADHAAEVDKDARFPVEAVQVLRESGALAALVPVSLGGAGAPFESVARSCFELGRHCGATAMVFAMHQIQVATLVRHHEEGDWFAGYLSRLVDSPRLIASVTSEVGTGGDMGRSIAALSQAEGGLCFEKKAPTVSYAAHADDYLTTVRRAADAEAGDQVAVLSSRDQTTLEPSGTWDPLGMRGTCSPGFTVRATVSPDQVLAAPFATIASESMVPISHIVWSHLWLGIATDAFDRARAFVKALAAQKPGEPVPAAARLSHVLSDLSLLRGEVGSALRDFVEMSEEPGRPRLSTMAAALRFNSLKLAASEQAPKVCQGALGVAGIVGFKNDTPFSVGRHLRDTMSACLMVANERIHETNAGLLLVAKEV